MSKRLSYAWFCLNAWPHLKVHGPVDAHEVFHLLQNWQIIFTVLMMQYEILEYIQLSPYEIPIFSCSIIFKHDIILCSLVVFLPAKMSATDFLPPNFLHILLFLAQRKKNSSTQLMKKMKTLLHSTNHNFLSCVMNVSFLQEGLPTSLPASAEISLPQHRSSPIILFLSFGQQGFCPQGIRTLS